MDTRDLPGGATVGTSPTSLKRESGSGLTTAVDTGERSTLESCGPSLVDSSPAIPERENGDSFMARLKDAESSGVSLTSPGRVVDGDGKTRALTLSEKYSWAKIDIGFLKRNEVTQNNPLDELRFTMAHLRAKIKEQKEDIVCMKLRPCPHCLGQGNAIEISSKQNTRQE